MNFLRSSLSSWPRFRLPTLMAFVLLGVTPLAAQTHVDLSAGSQATSQNLPLGQDLFVSLSGFQAGESLTVALYSPDGALLLSQDHTADARGAISDFRLWRNTGIRGCDSDLPQQAYPFLGIDDAQVWIYAQARVVVSSNDFKATPTTRYLRFIPDPEFHGFPADKELCFHRRFEEKEPVLLDLRPGTEPLSSLPVYKIWVLRCQDGPWDPGGVLVDARSAYPNGQTLQGSLPAVIQLVSAGDLPKGKYGILVHERTNGSDSTSRGMITNDTYLPMGPFDVGPAAGDPGTDIDEWGCIMGTSSGGGGNGGADP